MKVEIKISPDIKETYAVIYTSRITDEIQKLASAMGFESDNSVITAKDGDRIVVLRPKEIFMARVENEKTLVHTLSKSYVCPKRLYELEAQLGKDFMRISKSTLVNLKEISSIESSFSGMMLLILKNGCKDYISRKYLSDFKKYLGI